MWRVLCDGEAAEAEGAEEEEAAEAAGWSKKNTKNIWQCGENIQTKKRYYQHS